MFIIIAYILAIAFAELAGMLFSNLAGLLLHIVLLFLLLGNHGLKFESPYAPALPIIAIASLIRIFSLTIPIKEIPVIYWYVMIGIPTIISTLLAIRILELSWNNIGMSTKRWPLQFFIGLSGLPLSVAGFLILRPNSIISNANIETIVIGSLILIIFTGFLEEIIFRGMLQHALVQQYGHYSFLLSSLLFTTMFFSSRSWKYILFAGLIGLFFGWTLYRTNVIWGIAIAHSIISVGMLIIWPIMLQ